MTTTNENPSTVKDSKEIPVGDVVQFPTARAPRRPSSGPGRYHHAGVASESMTPSG